MSLPPGVTLHPPAGDAPPSSARVLTPAALAFVADLQRTFGERREALLAARRVRADRLAAGEAPAFAPATDEARSGDWRGAAAPADLTRRRVEITGPVERKMMINALNSGADCFMADLEDANSPTWANVVEGQANLMDAVRRTIALEQPAGKSYRLNDVTATLLVRPRGWHLEESHLRVDGAPASASLVDFGLHFFHNAAELVARGSGPYFYLPKLEGRQEARLWNDVFVHAQRALGIPAGTVRATVLVETVLAAFEMEEILYELRDHAAGLNAGRWDYIFSAIKKLGTRDGAPVLPDRAQVTMTVPFMRAYTELLVKTCHARGAHAIGGMAAFIPNRRDPEVTERAVAAVRADKLREAGDGFDGTWVAHPDLVPVAAAVFAEALGDRPHQKERRRDDVATTAEQLAGLAVPGGAVTDAGVRVNVDVALQYLEAWLRGAGAVAIHNLMEDAATAEISRAQLWQWVHRGVTTREGTRVDAEEYRRVRAEVLAALEAERAGTPHRLGDAAALLDRLVLADEFAEFLTLGAYAMLDAPAGGIGEERAVPMGSPDPEKPHGDPLRPHVTERTSA